MESSTMASIVSDLEITPVTNPTLSELPSIPNEDLGRASKHEHDQFLVDFHIPYDADNPKDWPLKRKWAVTDSLSASGFNRIMVSTIMAPALTTIQADLNMTSAEATMALSVYLLATAFGPLLLGPLSELYGRKRVMHASSAWFVAWNMACGFAPNKQVLIAARFLTGFGASAIYALGGGVLADVWRPEERGKGLRIYLLVTLLGVAVGPIVGGFMAGRASWRWMFWSTSIFQFLMWVVMWTTVRETYAPVILRRRARKLRRETGNSNYKTAYERLEDQKPLAQVLTQALTRPLRLLLFHPCLQIVAAIEGFGYGLLYIVLARFATVWIERYHESVEISGLHYIPAALGEIAASQLGGPLVDHYYHRMTRSTSRQRDHLPEFRLPLTIPFAVISPLGILLYGWAAEYRLPWPVVDLGIFVYFFASQAEGLPVKAYTLDAFPEHTSSAMAAVQFVRSMAAFALPLCAPALYDAIGYGWGNSVLAFAGILIMVSMLLVLWRFGARLRARSGGTY